MRTKKRCGLTAVVALLCFTLFCAVACSKGVNAPPGTEGNRLAEIGDISVSVTDYSYVVSWIRVENAEKYVLKCTDNGWTLTTRETSVDLRDHDDFVFPSSGTFTMTFVATSLEYDDSSPVTKTFLSEGRQLHNPEIISVDDGVIKWSVASGINTYILKVNGTRVRDGSDDFYHSDSYDASALTSDTLIELQACGDGVWLKNSPTLTFRYKAATKKLELLPITDYTLDKEVLKWDAVGGVTEYRVVDIEFNVTRVRGTSYDMFGKTLVYGVYPVSDSEFIQSAEITPVKIQYLEGNGTTASPYLIKTPFDLRAIDYYESRYEGVKNHYRIENDIDFDQVDVLEGESNIFTLNKPFFGVLDGNNKTLSNVFVSYDGGYWALFDHIIPGGEVKNMTFKNPNINNEMQDNAHPINASVATVAYNNYGTVSGISVEGAAYTVSGGEIGGIVVRNYGTVSGCKLSGVFKQVSTGFPDQAAYEMAGIVLENCSGGVIKGNTVSSLTIEGSTSYEGKKIINEAGKEERVEDMTKPYYNIRSVAGIVSVNRAGGRVENNGYTSLTFVNVNTGSEAGGIIAYNGATSSNATGNTSGTLKINGTTVSKPNGDASNNWQGKSIGKQG